MKTRKTADTPKNIKIGKQVWTAENLNVACFNNGDPIPEAESAKEWKKATKEGKPAWCHYNGKAENGKVYGKLYNWYAVTDSRGLAPDGWHIPTDKEWDILCKHLGGEDKAGNKMRTTSGWDYYENSNNSSGFSGLPAGSRGDDASFSTIDFVGHFWSSSEFDSEQAWRCSLGSTLVQVSDYKGSGLSVRCIKS